MGLTDKVSGRVKKATGDLLGDEKTRRQGAREERKDDVSQEAEQKEAEATAKRQEQANLERKT